MPDVSIGNGINTLTNEIKNQAVAIENGQIEKGIPDESFNSDVYTYYSSFDMTRSFQGSITLDVPKANVGTEIGAQYSSTKNVYEMFYVLRIIETEKQDKLKPPYSFKDPNILAKKLDKRSDGFYRILEEMGESFVNSITFGRELTAIIHFKFDSYEQMLDLNHKLGVTKGPVKLNSNFKTNLKSILKNVRYEIKIHSAGLEIPATKVLQTPEELIAYLDTLSDEKTQKIEPAALRYTTLPYTTISSEPLIRGFSNAIKDSKDLHIAISKCIEATKAALDCFAFEDGVAVTKEELDHDKNYPEQNEKKGALDRILINLKEANEKLLRAPFEKDKHLTYRILVNETISELKSIYEFIEAGKVNTALIRWISPEKINRANHKENWENDFSLTVPESAQRLQFLLTDVAHPGQNSNPDFKKLVKLKTHSRVGLFDRHTIMKNIYNATQVDAKKVTQYSLNNLYFKPHKISDNNSGHTTFGVGVYAIRSFRKPSPKLIPDKLTPAQIIPKSNAPDYNEKDAEACISALLTTSNPEKNHNKYLLSSNKKSSTSHLILPPVSDVNEFQQYLDKANQITPLNGSLDARIDIWDEIFPIIASATNREFKVIFPYKVNDNPNNNNNSIYEWVAAELTIKKTTVAGVGGAAPTVTYTTELCLHCPNRQQGNALNNVAVTNLTTAINTLVSQKLNINPAVATTIRDGNYHDGIANTIVANNLSLLNTVKDIQCLLHGITPNKNKIINNDVTEIRKQQIELASEAIQICDQEYTKSLHDYLQRNSSPAAEESQITMTLK